MNHAEANPRMVDQSSMLEATRQEDADPCVDTIVWKEHTLLMGWRTIPPYKNLWAPFLEEEKDIGILVYYDTGGGDGYNRQIG